MCNIEFEIPSAGFVTVKVVDIIGTPVKSLINALKQPGKHRIDFSHEQLLPGKYYYKVILSESEPAGSAGQGKIITQGKINIGRE